MQTYEIAYKQTHMHHQENKCSNEKQKCRPQHSSPTQKGSDTMWQHVANKVQEEWDASDLTPANQLCLRQHVHIHVICMQDACVIKPTRFAQSMGQTTIIIIIITRPSKMIRRMYVWDPHFCKREFTDPQQTVILSPLQPKCNRA